MSGSNSAVHSPHKRALSPLPSEARLKHTFSDGDEKEERADGGDGGGLGVSMTSKTIRSLMGQGPSRDLGRSPVVSPPPSALAKSPILSPACSPPSPNPRLSATHSPTLTRHRRVPSVPPKSLGSPDSPRNESDTPDRRDLTDSQRFRSVTPPAISPRVGERNRATGSAIAMRSSAIAKEANTSAPGENGEGSGVEPPLPPRNVTMVSPVEEEPPLPPRDVVAAFEQEPPLPPRTNSEQWEDAALGEPLPSLLDFSIPVPPPVAVLTPSERVQNSILTSRKSVSKIETDLDMLLCRGEELAHLEDVLFATGSSGSVVAVTGPHGCGKTLLMDHFRKIASEKYGVPSFYVQGANRYSILTPQSHSGDLWKNSDTFREFCLFLYDSGEGNASEDEGEALARNLRKLYGDALAPLFTKILPCEPLTALTVSSPGGSSPPSKEFEDEEDLEGLVLAALAQQFDQKYPGKKLLIIEDAYLLNAFDMSLIAAFVAECVDLMIVITSLDDLCAPELRNVFVSQIMNCTGDFHHVPLRPLPAEASILIGCDYLRVRHLHVSLQKVLQEQCPDNLTMVKEILRAAAEVGMIEVSDDGVASFRKGAGIPLLSLVQQCNTGVINSKLDELAPVLQVTLKVAAVAGNEFPLSCIQWSHPLSLSSRQLRLYLYYLQCFDFLEVHNSHEDQNQNQNQSQNESEVSQGFSESTGTIPFAGRDKDTHEAQVNLVYKWKSDGVRRHLYNSILYAHRQRLHHALAVYYEQRVNEVDDTRKGLSIVAYHWSKSATPVRAIHYFLENGNICLASYDFQSSTTIFNRALQISEGEGGDANCLFLKGICKEKIAIAMAIGGHLAKSVDMIGNAIPDFSSFATRATVAYPWLLLRSFVASRMPMLADSRRLLFKVEDGVEEESALTRIKIQNVFYSTVFSFSCLGKKSLFSEKDQTWKVLRSLVREMGMAKESAIVVGVEHTLGVLMTLTEKSGGNDKDKSTVTPLLTATTGAQDSRANMSGVVEPHQQVELYADACMAACCLGYIRAAEHFMGLCLRQGNSVYDIYAFGYALIQTAFFTVPRAMWAISTNNLKQGISLLKNCKRRVDRVVGVAHLNITLALILQGTLGKAIEHVDSVLSNSFDDESRMMLQWCKIHVLLMQKVPSSEVIALLDPILKCINTHFNHMQQFMVISVLCKHSWKCGFFSRTITSLLDAYNLLIQYGKISNFTYMACFAVCNLLDVVFDVMEDPQSLSGIQSFISADCDLKRITELLLSELSSLAEVYSAFEPRFSFYKGRLSWGLGKDKKAMKRFVKAVGIAEKHQLLLDIALLNRAIGERLANKKDRSAMLDSAHNMFWICNATAHLENDVQEDTPTTTSSASSPTPTSPASSSSSALAINQSATTSPVTSALESVPAISSQGLDLAASPPPPPPPPAALARKSSLGKEKKTQLPPRIRNPLPAAGSNVSSALSQDEVALSTVTIAQHGNVVNSLHNIFSSLVRSYFELFWFFQSLFYNRKFTLACILYFSLTFPLSLSIYIYMPSLVPLLLPCFTVHRKALPIQVSELGRKERCPSRSYAQPPAYLIFSNTTRRRWQTIRTAGPGSVDITL